MATAKLRRVLGLVLVVLSGCATQANYARYLDALTGESVVRVYSLLGYPTTEQTFTDGVKRLRYEEVDPYVAMPVRDFYCYGDYPLIEYSSLGYWVERYCLTDLFADASGQVTRWEMHGNSCGITEEELKNKLEKLGQSVNESSTEKQSVPAPSKS